MVRRLLENAAASGRELTGEEIARVRAHVCGVGFDPAALTRVSRRLYGQSWQGRVFGQGDRAPTEIVHYLRHRHEWLPDTTIDEYRQSLVETVRDPRGGILLEQAGGQWRLTFVAPSGRWRGLSGSDWMLVGYTINYGYWTIGYQLASSRDEVLALDQKADYARWLRRPS